VLRRKRSEQSGVNQTRQQGAILHVRSRHKAGLTDVALALRLLCKSRYVRGDTCSVVAALFLEGSSQVVQQGAQAVHVDSASS
jgi:hypothetical protein